MKLEIKIPTWARHIVSDLTDMDRRPHPVDARKVSQFTLELPDDVYFEYAFLDAQGQMRPDPENDVKADNPWFPVASAVYGPEYAPDPYASPAEEARGRLQRQRLESEHLKQVRRLTFYTPQGHGAEPLPVVYLQDGTAYLRIARLPAVLEALLFASEVRPAHLVFLEPVDRAAEYRYNPAYRAFMTEEVLPLAEERLSTSGERVAMGASLGGLLSATLALHHPEAFGAVVAQSGAFLGSPEEPEFYTGTSSWVLAQVEAGRGRTVRWSLETGTLEWLCGINRKLAAALEAGGYDYRYQERHAGHNWVNWRNGLAAALRFALAP